MGETVDEAIYLFAALDKMCHAQLMVEAAMKPGIEKKLIGDEEAAFTAATLQHPENVWANFQTEYMLLKRDHGHHFLQ